jgi:hypothetical protein
MTAEGRGAVTTTFAHPGTVYVVDDTTHRLLYSGDVRPGDRLNVDARHDEIWLNGQVVSHPRMDNSDHYKILMDQHPLAQGAYYNQQPGVMQQDTIVTTPGATVTTPGAPVAPGNGAVIEKKTTVEEKPAVIQEKTTVEKQVQPR